MKKLGLIVCFFYSCFISLAFSQNGLQQNIQQLLSRVKYNPNIGVVVSDAKTANIIFSQKPNYLFAPASVQKLFVAIAALSFLKPDFKFSTALLSNGKIHEHELKGDLYIKFSGDPDLTKENIHTLLSTLSYLGVKKINGKVYLDNIDYDNIPYAAGWMWDDLSYGYAAPLNAVIIDENKFILRLTPAKALHQAPVLEPDILASVVNFKNNIITTANKMPHCPITIYSDSDNLYYLNGCINQKWGRQRRTLAIKNPLLYAKALIEDNLKNLSILYRGNIEIKNAPNKATTLAEHVSKPLSEILKHMLKKSDNLITNTLLKKMGQLYFNKQGNWQLGLMAIQHILEGPTHIVFKHNLLNDGAGLSRYNLVSPEDLIKLLNYAYQNPLISPVLLTALPIAGEDGTLKGRMLKEQGHIHAKTGSMTGISSLAGYVFTNTHRVYSFAILVNGFVGKGSTYLALEDKLCLLLASYRG